MIGKRKGGAQGRGNTFATSYSRKQNAKSTPACFGNT